MPQLFFILIDIKGALFKVIQNLVVGDLVLKVEPTTHLDLFGF